MSNREEAERLYQELSGLLDADLEVGIIARALDAAEARGIDRAAKATQDFRDRETANAEKSGNAHYRHRASAAAEIDVLVRALLSNPATPEGEVGKECMNPAPEGYSPCDCRFCHRHRAVNVTYPMVCACGAKNADGITWVTP